MQTRLIIFPSVTIEYFAIYFLAGPNQFKYFFYTGITLTSLWKFVKDAPHQIPENMIG